MRCEGAQARVRAFVLLVALLLSLVACGRREAARSDDKGPTGGADQVTEAAQRQIAALVRDKGTRPPAQRKLDSQLVYALRMRRGEPIAAGIERLETSVSVAPDGSVAVEIDTHAVEPVTALVADVGGEVIGVYPGFGGVTARVPLTALERFGALPDVKFVRELRAPVLNREVGERAQSLAAVERAEGLGGAYPTRERLREALAEAERRRSDLTGAGHNAVGGQTNLVNTSQGVTVHRADVAQSTYGALGQGIKVGVLSDSVDYLAQVQAQGDLPAVTVLSGQSGVPGTGEGTAMLEIVHDMAPSAELYFATAFGGVASFAANIVALRAAGCDIIVDDVFYFNESPFQDGPIAAAVSTVTAAGAIYLSSAGNAGSLGKGTAGVYEGNFVDSGTSIAPLSGFGAINQFTDGTTTLNYNRVAGTNGSAPVTLFWSDRLGGSSNDYDLFILNSTLTAVVNASTNFQTGTQDPYEQSGISPSVGRRIVVVKATSAQTRYLHLNSNRGRLDIVTTGQNKGHSAAADAFAVAATPAANAIGAGQPAGPYPSAFSAANVVENFSSDGARRIFYDQGGTLLNTTNPSLLADGGVLRQKPDITAADGVSTATPGFDPFFGTSAAAPHAAGIVAQMKSAAPAATPAEIRLALTTTAIDIEGAGVEVNSGAGIVMSDKAVAAIAGSPDGTVCTDASECSSGNCIDGVCCDEPCGGGDPNDCQACSAAGVCGAAPSSTVCRAAVGACDVEETCGGAGVCPADAAVTPGTACGGAPTGVCDAQDTCSGTVGATATCAANFQPSSVECRPAAGACDVAESCTGTGPNCPSDLRVAAGTTCRGAADTCDAVETCDGVGVDCPTDARIPAGTTCRPAAGVCDVAEACDGLGVSCPGDARLAAGTVCRPSSGACDPAEACDGSVDCPVDAAAPVGTPCGGAPSGVCDAQDTCSGTVGASATCTPQYQPSSVVCRSAAGACDVAESCTGSSASCPNDTLVASGTVCRPAASACDVAEACDGASPACDADAAAPVGTPCGGTPSGVCDAQDTCSGTVGASATCTANYQPASVVCRPAAGACDVAEACTGAATSCPNDTLVASGTVCRPAASACDVAEACDGASPACDADAAAPVGTPCGGAPSGVCDAQDTCSGTVGASATCTANYQPASVVCRPAAGACDVAEACTGASRSCPNDTLVASGTVCRPAASACDVAEACDGASPACDADAAAPVGTPCGGAPSGVCDAQDTCSGTVGASATCTANYQPASVVCRPAAGDCDIAEACSGASASCPSDALRPSATVCRPAAGSCDVPEACTGTAPACPQDALVSAGTVCRDAVSECDAAETCTGASPSCAADAAKPVGTACGAAPSGACDAQDTCSGTVGASAACSAMFQPSGTVCRSAAGDCDVAEVCTGAAAACPSDALSASGATCSDGDACTSGDACDGTGACTPGAALDCDDQNPCTADGCDPTLGCVATPVPDGTACSDDNACTAGDACTSGSCGAGPALDCDDQNPCTIDQCDTGSGCVHVLASAGAACEDGDVCTSGDACDGTGTCTRGSPLDCDDGNECTADVCRQRRGCVHDALDGRPCRAGAGRCVGDTCELGPDGSAGESGAPGEGGSSGSAGSTAGRGGATTGGVSSGGTKTGGSAATGAAGSNGEAGEGLGGEGGEGGESTGTGAKAPEPPFITHHRGCGCRASPSPGGQSAWWLGMMLASMLVRRRGRVERRASTSFRRGTGVASTHPPPPGRKARR